MSEIFMYRLILLSALLVLTACAKPTLNTPGVDPQALQREQQMQQDILRSQGGVPTNPTDDANRPPAPAFSSLPPDIQATIKTTSDRVQNAGQQVCQMMRGSAQGCYYEMVLKDGGKAPDAYADGKGVYFNMAMVMMTENPDQLAFVLSHEYGHNILQHVNSKQQNAMVGTLLGLGLDLALKSKGYGGGQSLAQTAGGLAANAYSIDFEKEADYIGLYIMDRAGFNIVNAPNVWRRMTVNNPRTLYVRTTHPTNPERFIEMQNTINEIIAKKQSGQLLLPNARAKK
jgi:Zn-dependent protease with chaperone function